jgi:hypothetical protein
MKRKRIAGTAVAGILATLALGAVAAADPTLTLDRTATLAAKGAGVNVSVEVSCEAVKPSEGSGGSRGVFVQVTQAVGDAIASGGGSVDQFDCDGAEQALEVLVTADPNSRPFRKGVAVAKATLSICAGQEPFECQTATDQGEIEIEKKKG